MSFSFYVRNIAANEAGASLHDLIAALPYSDVAANPPVPEGGWPELAHLYRDGVSARPVETSLEGDLLQVRIFSASAPEDYQLALNIIEQAARRYGQPIESEEGVTATADTLRDTYNDAWVQRHAADTFGMVLNMQGREDTGNLQLSGVNATMTLGPRLAETLHQHNGSAAEVFFDRFRRLNFPGDDVYQAGIIVVGSESTDKVARLSTFGKDVPTLFSTRARFIALTDSERDEHMHIKFDDFIAISDAGSLQWLSEDAVIAEARDGAAWDQLMTAARPLAVEDFFAFPELLDEPEPAADEGADAEKMLVSAPVAIFLLVAAADGSIDKKEVAAFQSQLVTSLASTDERVGALSMACMAQFQEILGGLQSGGPDLCLRVLIQARAAAERVLGADNDQQYLVVLNDMAISIAEASGGGLFGFGKKIGKEERAVLELIEQALLGGHS
ncbi:MAG: DUF4299 domain-containing protein [Gammaproteobacteria bacterium]|nr:DUF4299 domain-containing protein [Gammaproteobacteria bacterium]